MFTLYICLSSSVHICNKQFSLYSHKHAGKCTRVRTHVYQKSFRQPTSYDPILIAKRLHVEKKTSAHMKRCKSFRFGKCYQKTELRLLMFIYYEILLGKAWIHFDLNSALSAGICLKNILSLACHDKWLSVNLSELLPRNDFPGSS